jgi:hypothetical protein
MSGPPTDIERELAALADGSLEPGQRERVLARVAESRELQNALAEQQRAVALTALVQEQAPASLHRRIEAMAATTARGEHGRARADRRRGVRWRSWRLGVVGTAVAALAVAAVAITQSGGGSSSLSVQQAAALTLSPATMGAPTEDRAHSAQLAAAVGGVPFPYWKERFGWRSSGARSDMVAGHSITTVFYTDADGRRIGYAIASGRAPLASGGTLVRRWGVDYRVLGQDGATVVTWRRSGHLCVVAGRGVSARTLLHLASWGSEKSHSA